MISLHPVCHTVQCCGEMMIEFLLRHSYGLWQLKTGKPDAVLPQGNSCQEKHTQLRLPLVDSIA
jgi:hypothetical protein